MVILLLHPVGVGMTMHYCPFAGQGTEARVGHVTCPGSHSWRVAEVGSVDRAGRDPAYVPNRAESQGRK